MGANLEPRRVTAKNAVRSGVQALLQPFAVLVMFQLVIRVVFPSFPTIATLVALVAIPISAMIGFLAVARTYRQRAVLLAIVYFPAMVVLLGLFGLFFGRAITGIDDGP